MRKVCIWVLAIIGLLVVAGVVGGLLTSDGEDQLDQPPASAPRLTAQELLAEREANATRFDAQRKGQWVRVSGRIERIDEGNVYLRGDGFLSNVVLEDLSRETQIPLNTGEDFSAACKVGNYILGSIFMEDCQALR